MDVRFVDTTFRDGSQSLWASYIRGGMIEAVAGEMDQAGLDVIEAPVIGIYFKKFVREMKEDPWEMVRMVARTMPNTVKSCMAPAGFHPFEAPPPRAVIELFFTRLAEISALNRAQMTCNTLDQLKGTYQWFVPVLKKLGMEISLSLSYTISPRHTDEYYAEKTKEILQFEPDNIYLKDQGGLLTPDSIRGLLPGMVAAAGDVPVELHSHCTTGLADLVYMEALELGVGTLHTGIPPLAEGSAQPSIFNVAANARMRGYSTHIDEAKLRGVSDKLTAFARQEGLPLGAPMRYDHNQYVHQVPGGVISNLRHQLAELGLQDRLDEVLEETVRVRADMGFPIMITPHSQFVVTQSAINVAQGERYKMVIDELILFAMGVYGEDSGAPWMDQNLKDRLLDLPRAGELKSLAGADRLDMSLDDVRRKMGATGLTDEEFLLRYIMKGESEIQAMRDAGAPKKYFDAGQPLATLLDALGKQDGVRYIHMQRGTDSLMLAK